MQAEELIKFIEDNSRPVIPINIDLWSSKEVAAFLKIGTRKVGGYACRPDFPKPYRLPSDKGRGHKRWKAKEIIAWSQKLQSIR